MSNLKQKSLLIKAREEVTFLEDQQIKIYEKLCRSLKTKDNEGFVWDYVFNNSDDIEEVLLEMNSVE
jgi:hypothetical protein